MNPKKAQDIIDRIINPTNCHCKDGKCGHCFSSWSNEPILIGDVLEKAYSPTDEDLGKLYDTWRLAAGEYDLQEGWVSNGFTKSLQDILRDGVEEKFYCGDHDRFYEEGEGTCTDFGDTHVITMEKELTTQTERLFTFINEIL